MGESLNTPATAKVVLFRMGVLTLFITKPNTLCWYSFYHYSINLLTPITKVVNYVEAASLLFLIVAFRLVSGSGVYTKIKYILMLLVGLGGIFVEFSLNFILPIFYTLELGTALFVIMIMKSYLRLWAGQGTLVWYGLPMVGGSTFLYLTIESHHLPQNGSVVFLDTFAETHVYSEFVVLVLPLLKHQAALLFGTLVFIIAATGIVIANRQSVLAPAVQINKPGRVDVYQKIRDFIFSIHKNILHPFMP